MKASWIWILIAAAFGGVWFFRSRKPSAAKATGLPEGAVIGQIGSRIEDSKGTLALAESLRASAVPRVSFVSHESGSDHFWRFWSDGGVEVVDGSGNVVLSKPYIPSP